MLPSRRCTDREGLVGIIRGGENGFRLDLIGFKWGIRIGALTDLHAACLQVHNDRAHRPHSRLANLHIVRTDLMVRVGPIAQRSL